MLGVPHMPKAVSESDFIKQMSQKTGKGTKEIKEILQAQQAIAAQHLKKGSDVKIPGLTKLKIKKVPAQKGGQKKPNPFKPGEMMVTKAKPASVRVKSSPLGKLKKLVTGK